VPRLCSQSLMSFSRRGGKDAESRFCPRHAGEAAREGDNASQDRAVKFGSHRVHSRPPRERLTYRVAFFLAGRRAPVLGAGAFFFSASTLVRHFMNKPMLKSPGRLPDRSPTSESAVTGAPLLFRRSGLPRTWLPLVASDFGG
jgi:hypothetical protein